MVVLIPNNPNPTHADIDAYIRDSLSSSSQSALASSSVNQGITEIQNTIREIHSKSGVGALLHPAEEYFFEVAEAALTVARITP